MLFVNDYGRSKIERLWYSFGMHGDSTVATIPSAGICGVRDLYSGRICFDITQDYTAMAHMSPAKVAWMGALMRASWLCP